MRMLNGILLGPCEIHAVAASVQQLRNQVACLLYILDNQEDLTLTVLHDPLALHPV